MTSADIADLLSAAREAGKAEVKDRVRQAVLIVQQRAAELPDEGQAEAAAVAVGWIWTAVDHPEQSLRRLE